MEFGALVADDLAMATTILTTAGLEVTDRCRSELTAYLAQDPRGEREAGWSTTCTPTSGSIRTSCRALRRSILRRSRRSPGSVTDHERDSPRTTRRRCDRPGDGRTGRSMSAMASGCHQGCRTATCSSTDDGRIVVNTGMGFEGPLHRRAYDAVELDPDPASSLPRATSTMWVVRDSLRDEGTELIAQANFSLWRADNERLERFRSRNAAFAWMRAIVAAMEHTEVARRPDHGASSARADEHFR